MMRVVEEEVGDDELGDTLYTVINAHDAMPWVTQINVRRASTVAKTRKGANSIP